jgi:magnesium transporter
MARFLKKRIENKGSAPGTLIFIGEKKMEESKLSIIDFNKDELKETPIENTSDLIPYKNSDSVTWINIYGLHNTEMIKQIGEIFDLHALLLEDILFTGQRPKLEEFDNCLLTVVKMIRYDDSLKQIHSEQLSLVLGTNFVISFQEQKGDVFEHLRDRIRMNKGRVRNSGSDYLFYSLLDTVVDNYIYSIERIGEQIEEMEDDILDRQDKTFLNDLRVYKREVSYFLKITRPVLDIMMRMLKLETELIKPKTIQYVKDLQDLVIHCSDSLLTYRELLTDFLTIHQTDINNRMNEVMKVLTVFSAIFIPLTFIAGIYGTNFDYLPELHYKYSYFIMLGIMVLAALNMMFYFKRKKWF